MSARNMLGFAPALGITDLIAGGVLLVYSWGLSWFTYTPPTSSTPRTVFHPFVTFYPSLLLLVMGVVELASFAITRRQPGAPLSRLVRGFSVGHVALGAVLLLVAIWFYSFYFTCADPGGCREYFDPFWPLILPGIFLLGVGLAGLVVSVAYIGRVSMGQG